MCQAQLTNGKSSCIAGVVDMGRVSGDDELEENRNRDEERDNCL
jgi:hypothetical protein